MQGEDVEDERRTVDDLHVAAHRLLEVRLLGGRQLVVEHDEVGRVGARKLGLHLLHVLLHLLGLLDHVHVDAAAHTHAAAASKAFRHIAYTPYLMVMLSNC